MTPAPHEEALQFGDENGLLGIATLPAVLVQARPAVVLLNAGLVHRVGPLRMHVVLARRLAAAGFLTVRIDQSGLGDSLPDPGGLSSEERAVRDAQQALDAVSEHYGVNRFVLVGLCAGAMSVHRAALADRRVVGACLLDGYAYPTPKSRLHAMMARAADPVSWRRVARKVALWTRRTPLGAALSGTLRGREGSTLVAAEELSGEETVATRAPHWPPREVIADELHRLVARGVRMLFIYTGGWSGYVHQGQFDEMFPHLPRREQVETELYPDADHTYLILAHRERMLRRIEQFLSALA